MRAGFAGCSILITSDKHLTGIDQQELKLLFDALDVAAPIIATPRQITQKFFRKP